MIENVMIVITAALGVWLFGRLLIWYSNRYGEYNKEHTHEYLHIQAEIKGEIRDFAIIFVDDICRGAVELYPKEQENENED